MSFTYDPNRVPSDFDPGAFDTAVNTALQNLGAPTDTTDLIYAAVKGMLLLDDHGNPAVAGFSSFVQKAWIEFMDKTNDVSGNQVTNRVVYQFIRDTLLTLPGRSGSDIFYQEFASVGRYVISRTDEVPFGHLSFSTQVRLGDDAYVAAQTPFGTLQLPPLTGTDGSAQEVQPDNTRAVGTIFAGFQLEQLKLFAVVDRLVELFMNGMLAIGLDKGGQLLNEQYNFSITAPEYMNQQHRYMHYGRLFGARGGEVSHEVQPNTDFDKLWMRALSSLSEYDRQQRIVDLFTGQTQARSLSRTGENVRSAIRDLANNASLYGWGYTHFAARNLTNQVTRALNILNSPFIQRTCAASTPWQVIEYYARDLGTVPNVVKYRTMAEQSNVLFNLIAKYSTVWSGSSGRPLFPDPAAQGGLVSGDAQTSDISPDDTIRFMRSTELILAVIGIKDDQVTQYSEPVESVAAPSMPIQYDTGKNAGFDQIREIVAQGRAPTMEELQRLIPANGARAGVGMKVGV